MNSWRLTKISPEEYEEWFEDNYQILQNRSPFHHPAWLETVAHALNFKTGYIARYEEKELVAVIPGFLHRLGPIRLFGSPLRGTMTSYLGPVSLESFSSDQAKIDILSACGDFVRKEWGVPYSRFTLRNQPASETTLSDNWAEQRPGSYRLDLTKGSEDLWKGLKSDCRRNIRKAREAGIEIVPLEDADLFFKMVDATFRRHGSTSWHKANFFRALISELVPRDLLWSWGARYQGKIISGAFFLHDDQEVHFISGASSPEFAYLPTSYLLHWNAIEVSANMGLRIYNSDRSRVPSIDKFKESFRPIFERRHTLIYAPGYLRRAQKIYMKTYSRFRQLKSHYNPGKTSHPISS
jgi:CelD/BcsL family acetyltransferase involved in cellulose biosynthesis